jgi:hypothetical protein
MKRLLSIVALLATHSALAHPGHGKPGIFHHHQIADLFADAALLFAGVLMLAVLGVALARAIGKGAKK